MANVLNFVMYDDTGRITSVQRAPEGILIGQMLEVPEWREDYDRTHYVENEVLLERPANPAVLDGGTLTSLPVPSIITINGKRYNCTDTTAELDFTYPGNYEIGVEAFPHMTAYFTETIS